jgi:uncharacterized protein with ParB-like and HNH nuclease domain
MRANATKFLAFLHKANQFVIPIYQRSYSWDEKQCQQLWEDILRVGANDSVAVHFIGSIVYVEGGQSSVSLQAPLLVIDGQQRLTTLQILIHALLECTKEMELEDVSLRLQDLVYNPKHYAKNQSDQIKLTPTNQDRHAFQKVLSGDSAETDLEKITNNIYAAHAFFNYGFKTWIQTGSENQTKNYSPHERAASLASGVSYFLNMVVIDLNIDDDAQLIFETLNARGTPLSPSDLIKNAIFQKL